MLSVIYRQSLVKIPPNKTAAVAVAENNKSRSGLDLFWKDLKISDTDLNGQSNLSWHCYQFFSISDIKKM